MAQSRSILAEESEWLATRFLEMIEKMQREVDEVAPVAEEKAHEGVEGTRVGCSFALLNDKEDCAEQYF